MEFVEVNKERLRFGTSKGFTSVLVVFFIALPLLLFVSMMSRSSNFDLSSINRVEGRNGTAPLLGVSEMKPPSDSSNESPQPSSSTAEDKFLIDSVADRFINRSGPNYEPSLQPNKPSEEPLNGTIGPETDKVARTPASTNGGKPESIDGSLFDGLIPSGFDKSSCLSRYQSVKYRRISPYKPSPFLIEKLRSYEKLHARCGPHTEAYNKTLKVLSQNRVHKPSVCKYIIWRPVNGLGNRMISLAASFLYALLTNRVLLVYNSNDMANLFCEPFPNSSWLLPVDFPLKTLIRKSGVLGENEHKGATPSFLHLTLQKRDSPGKRYFFCDQGQTLVREIPWLVILSEQYFAPSFFVMKSFGNEVSQLFPCKETVFHHLGRYLFNPSNQVWGPLITKFFSKHLAKADKRVGLQIRVFHPNAEMIQITMDQLLACNSKAKFIPKLGTTKKAGAFSSKAILVTSLYTDFYKNLSVMYSGKATATGEVVSVYQPSHEGYQHKGDNVHNMKAWAEMYLLSLCDVLVTSSWSTFGYVAQGLGGLKPWILHRHGKGNYRPCRRAESIEPCFHYPSSYDCRSGQKIDPSALVPFIGKCEDREFGVKLFNVR